MTGTRAGKKHTWCVAPLIKFCGVLGNTLVYATKHNNDICLFERHVEQHVLPNYFCQCSVVIHNKSIDRWCCDRVRSNLPPYRSCTPFEYFTSAEPNTKSHKRSCGLVPF